MREMVDGPRGAFLAVVLTAIGTFLAADVSFPADPARQGALVVPGMILAMGIVIVPVLRAVTGAATMTNAESFVAFGFVFWLLLDLIQGAYALDEARPESLRLALVAIGVSAAAMWIGTMARPWRVPRWIGDALSRPLDVNVVWAAVPICFVLGMFNFVYSVDFDIPRMFSYVGEQRWAMPWNRGQLGGWDTFRDQTQYFGYVLPSLTAVLIARRGLRHPQTLFAIACSAIVLLFLSTGGGRRIVAAPMGAALIVWLQLNPGQRVRNAVVVAAGAALMAWTAQFMLNVRSAGYEAYLERGSEYDYLHVDDNFLRLAQVIEIVPARRNFVGSQQVVFALVRPVPRVLWPGKPVSPGFDLPTEVGMKGLSLSTSIIGEWYLSWGWLAVIFGGWFHGRLAAIANTMRTGARSNPIVYGLLVMVLMAGMRSMIDLVLMSYALAAWWAVAKWTAPAPAVVYVR